jgi:hypothetical protein
VERPERQAVTESATAVDIDSAEVEYPVIPAVTESATAVDIEPAEGGASPAAQGLGGLIEKINASHRKCLAFLRKSLKYAREAGTLLLQAKEKVTAAGLSWQKWVQDRCHFSIDTAQRYMRVADRYGELRQQGVDLSKLSMAEALRLLSPKTGAAARRPAPPAPLKVGSYAEVKRVRRQAEELRLADDAAEKQLVADKVASLVRQVLAQAGRSKLQGAGGQPLGKEVVAVALLALIQKELDPGRVLEVEEPQAGTATAAAPPDGKRGRAEALA